jgi:hypothetical protein
LCKRRPRDSSHVLLVGCDGAAAVGGCAYLVAETAGPGGWAGRPDREGGSYAVLRRAF